MPKKSAPLERLLKRIGALPQAGHLKGDDVTAWLRATLATDPSRINWHIRRAGGFGGSEMGALVAAIQNRSGRMSPHRIIRQKLLRLPPDRPNVDMRRGLAME